MSAPAPPPRRCPSRAKVTHSLIEMIEVEEEEVYAATINQLLALRAANNHVT